MTKFKLDKLRLSTKILIALLVFVFSVGSTLIIIYRNQIFAQEAPPESETVKIEPSVPRPPKRVTVEYSRYDNDPNRAKVVIRWEKPSNLSKDCPYITKDGKEIDPDTQSNYLRWHLNWYGPNNIHYGPKVLDYGTSAFELSNTRYVQWGKRSKAVIDLKYDAWSGEGGSNSTLIGRSELVVHMPQNYNDPMRLKPSLSNDPKNYIDNPKLQIERFSELNKFKVGLVADRSTNFANVVYLIAGPNKQIGQSGIAKELSLSNLGKNDTGIYKIQKKNLHSQEIDTLYEFNITDWYPDDSFVTVVNECPGEENCGTVTDSPEPGEEGYGDSGETGGDDEDYGFGTCKDDCIKQQDCGWVDPICKGLCSFGCAIMGMVAGLFNWAFGLLAEGVGLS